MESTYDIRKVLGLIFLIILVVAISAGGAFALSSLADKTYTAESQVVVTAGLGTTNSTDDVLTAPRIGQTYAALAMTRPVLLDVIRRARLPYDPAELALHLRVSADPVSPFVVIAATDKSPSRSEQIANALADVLIERARGSSTPGFAEQSILEIVERAVIPVDPSGPRVLFNTILAGAIALVLALAIVALIGYLGGERPARQSTNG